ncbi:MAG: signal peptide peptidase SppA [Myxococcota bacterium]
MSWTIRSARAVTLAAGLFSTLPLLAQNLPDRLGAGTPPPGTVATVDEAHATVINPAGLAFMEGPQLVVAHSGLDYLGPTGASDGAYGGVRFFRRISFAAGLEWIRPPMSFYGAPTFSAPQAPFQPLLGASVLRLSGATAFRISDEISVGMAYRHIFGTSRRLYDLGTVDLGVQVRPLRYVAAGLTLEQANSPFAGNDRMLRSIRAGLAIRPLWERITLSTEARIDEQLRLDTNWLARAEILPGISLLANAFWLDMLQGTGQAAYNTAKDNRLSDLPFIGGQLRGVGVPSLQRIGFGVGLQLDLEHLGAGMLGTWTPGAGFLQPYGGVPNPLTGGMGTLGGVSVWGRASVERYQSIFRSGRRAIAVRVEDDLQGVGPENPAEQLIALLSADEGPGETIAVLDRAVQDARVKVVLLRIRAIKAGWGRIVEVRQRVEALRRAKKRVVAFMESAGDEEYHIASACDRIYLAPAGVLGIDGFAVTIQFFGAALDRIGVHVEAVAAGKYKSAPEQLMRTEPTPENLEVQRSILDGLYDVHVNAISRNRGIPADRVRQLLDRGAFSAKEALEERLIDGIAYEDELPERVGKDLGGGEIDFDDEYGNEELRQWRWAGPVAIGVVMVRGEIRQGRSGPGLNPLGGGSGAGADDVVSALRAAEEDDNIKAVVLRVDSPGGDSLASDLIWAAVKSLRKKKPVIASFGDLAASGGYYVSCGADLIIAEPTTLTGSIGVFALRFELKDLMDRFGVTTYEETRGKVAGGGLHRPMSDEERALMERFVGVTYEQFLERVREGRKFSDEKVREIAQGRVWTGVQAKEIGLVDELGGLPEAIELAKARVGLKGDRTVEIQIVTGEDNPVTRWGSALNTSISMLSGEHRRQQQVRNATRLLLGDPEIVDKALLAQESRSLAMMPYTVRVR